jgi:hypothetical protein
MPMPDGSLEAQWSTIYHPEWDTDPERYLNSGLVKWGRNRRLARFDDRLRGFRAYIGLHHSDPSRFGASGQAQTRYFLSLFVLGQTVSLHTYDTFAEAQAALATFYRQLVDKPLPSAPGARSSKNDPKNPSNIYPLVNDSRTG